MDEQQWPGIRNVLLVTLLFVVLTIAGGLLAGIAGNTLVTALPGSPGTARVAGTLSAVAMVAVYLVIFRICSKKSGLRIESFVNARGLRPAILVPFIVLMASAAILLSDLDNLLQSVFPMPRFLADAMSGLALDEYLSFALVSLVAIPAIFEEVLFRGFFVQGLRRRYAAPLVIVLTAALFGLVHLNPWQFPAAFLLGLLFGWVSWHTGSITLTMLGHAFNNLLFLITVRYPGLCPVPGFNTGSAAITFQPLWLDLVALACAASALVLLAREFAKPVSPSPAA